MASDSEGLRLSAEVFDDLYGPLCRKWLPIRKGYDQAVSPDIWTVSPVENGFRFGRVTTFRIAPGTVCPFHGRKWLPIRKGYDFFSRRVVSCIPARRKWLSIRKGYDVFHNLDGLLP